jgi:hypothetical protein
MLSVIVSVVFVLLVLRRRRNEEDMIEYRRRSLGNFEDTPEEFENMTPEDLTNFINKTRDEYTAWAGTQATQNSNEEKAGQLSKDLPLDKIKIVKDVFIGIAASPDTILFVVRLCLKYVLVGGFAEADKRLSTIIAKEELKKNVKNIGRLLVKGAPSAGKAASTGLKSGARAAISAASKAATRAAFRAALLAAGPAGAAAEAGLFVMQATFGMMDQFGVGGYEELVSERMYAGMRDYYDRELEAEAKRIGLTYPIPYGPLEKLDSETLKSEHAAECAKIMENENHPGTKMIQLIVITLYRTLGRDPTDSEIKDAVYKDPTGVITVINKAAYNELAKKYNGKIVMVDNTYVRSSYLTKEAAESSFKWPLSDEKEYYVEWDDTQKISYIRPSVMKVVSEGLGFGCTYDKVRRLPYITEKYCLENGLYHDGQGKQCKYREGQELAEMIFGKAFVRGLLQVFDPKMYKSCSDMEWCKDGKCKDDGAYFCTKNSLSYSRKPEELECPKGYSDNKAGMCNPDCPPGFYRLGIECLSNESKNKLPSIPATRGCPSGYFRDAGLTRCYNKWCDLGRGEIHSRCTLKPSPCKNEAACWINPEFSCPTGYSFDGVTTCNRIRRPVDTTAPKSKLEVGVCPSGTSKYAKGDALCYGSCKIGFDSWPAGLCNSKNPKLQIKPKERKAPYGETDFENSPVGKRIQAIKDNVREGDVAGVGAGMGALFLQANPIVTGLGLHDFANMIPNV